MHSTGTGSAVKGTTRGTGNQATIFANFTNRTRYLGEVAEAVRRYHAETPELREATVKA